MSTVALLVEQNVQQVKQNVSIPCNIVSHKQSTRELCATLTRPIYVKIVKEIYIDPYKHNSM